MKPLNTLDEFKYYMENKYKKVPIVKKECLNNGIDFLFNESSKLRNINESVQLFQDYLTKHKKIFLLSDSDTDGIGTYYIFNDFFKNVLHYPDDKYEIQIVNRNEGYGLLPKHVEYCKENGFELIITADQGISSMSAVDWANELGIKVIITDHHTTDKDSNGLETIPDTPYIINPQISPEYPYTNISGTCVLAIFLWNVQKFNPKRYLLEIYITTISDVMPINEKYNFCIIVNGLNLFQNQKDLEYILSTRQYLNTILDKLNKFQLDPNDIGFKIAPMLNAANRLTTAYDAGNFIIEEDEQKSQIYWDKLDKTNEERKDIQRKLTNRIFTEYEHLLKLGEPLIFIDISDKHIKSKGDTKVLGLLAAKITNEYNVPALVTSYKEDQNIFSGSGRSPYNVIDILRDGKEHGFYHHIGGHGAAFGIGIYADKIDEFRDWIQKNEKLRQLISTPPIIGVPITVNLISDQHNLKQMYELLEKFGPYGKGYEQQQLVIVNSKIKSVNKFGKEKQHRRITITDGSRNATLILFNVPKYFELQESKGRLSGKNVPAIIVKLNKNNNGMIDMFVEKIVFK